MIAYQDFVPKKLAEDVLQRGIHYETFDEAVKAANEWIQQQSVKVLHVETVVLPNIWRPSEQGTRDGAIRIFENEMAYWHQFVRVWYETG